MAFFIPLITATGGNVGIQSSSLVVQSLVNPGFVDDDGIDLVLIAGEYAFEVEVEAEARQAADVLGAREEGAVAGGEADVVVEAAILGGLGLALQGVVADLAVADADPRDRHDDRGGTEAADVLLAVPEHVAVAADQQREARVQQGARAELDAAAVLGARDAGAGGGHRPGGRSRRGGHEAEVEAEVDDDDGDEAAPARP